MADDDHLLSPDVAKKVLNRDLANLLKKVQGGKTLTRAERELIASSAQPEEDPEFAGTWTALADELDINRGTLRKWRKMDGAPTTTNIRAWQLFIENNGLGVAPNRMSRSREDVQIEKTLKEIELLDVRIKREERSVISIEEHDDYVSRLAQSVRAALLTFENIVPRLAGKSQSEMRQEIRAEVDRYISMFRKTMDEWQSGNDN